MENTLFRGMSKNKGFRFFFVQAKQLVQTLHERHQTSPVVSAALGRTALVASILAQMNEKTTSSVTVRIQGDGPIGQIVVVAKADGGVKGYVTNPQVDIPLKRPGKLDVGTAVGKHGNLSVVYPTATQNYTGISPLVSGEIGEDFAHYFYYSEQKPSMVMVGVLIGRDHHIEQAGALIIQTLPDALEEQIDELEAKIKDSPSLTSMLNRGMNSHQIIGYFLGNDQFEIYEKRSIRHRCECSKEKMIVILNQFPPDEKASLKEEEVIEIRCHFCNEFYQISPDDIE